jgi:hypothetical protein
VTAPCRRRIASTASRRRALDPFNALLSIFDLNTALVAYLLCGHQPFVTAAGYVGPKVRVDHDISLLVPEIWARLAPAERDPEYLLRGRLIEPVQDIEWEGEIIPARRLGYRVTGRFVQRYFGRVFDSPDKVFDDAILRPETQDPAAFADGVKYIMEAYARTALQYFADGTIEECCPPLTALLHIMAYGHHEGRDERDPAIRALFTRDSALASDWYHARLRAKQDRDVALWRRHLAYLDASLARPRAVTDSLRSTLEARRDLARMRLEAASAASYRDSLTGTIGVQPWPASAAP